VDRRVTGERKRRRPSDGVIAVACPVVARRAKKSFIVFIDRIFTIFIETAFTNDFDASSARDAIACVCRAGHAD
jgi:hypothetical protein